MTIKMRGRNLAKKGTDLNALAEATLANFCHYRQWLEAEITKAKQVGGYKLANSLQARLKNFCYVKRFFEHVAAQGGSTLLQDITTLTIDGYLKRDHPFSLYEGQPSKRDRSQRHAKKALQVDKRELKAFFASAEVLGHQLLPQTQIVLRATGRKPKTLLN